MQIYRTVQIYFCLKSQNNTTMENETQINYLECRSPIDLNDWKCRHKQIDRVIINTTGMHGRIKRYYR